MRCLALAAALVFSGSALAAEPLYGNDGKVEFLAFRCKAACPSGKFRYVVFAVNKTMYRASFDKNDIKYKLKFSYKPPRPKSKGARRGPAPGYYKTLDFMPAGVYAQDLAEVNPGEILGIQVEVDVGSLDAGICRSDAVTLHGTLPLILESGPTSAEVNLKVKGSCDF